jgi:hypothetical protein
MKAFLGISELEDAPPRRVLKRSRADEPEIIGVCSHALRVINFAAEQPAIELIEFLRKVPESQACVRGGECRVAD